MIGQGSYKAAESETQQLAAAPIAAAGGADHQRRSKPHPNQVLKCPRCESLDTKFCYYNNYSLTQPRYFCKNCKRYWTAGGTLRNVPVGGGLRKNKRSKQKAAGLGVNKSDHHISPSLEQSLPGHPNIGLTAAAGSSNSSNSAPEIANLIPYPTIVPPADSKFVYDSGRMGQSTKLINPAAHTAGGTPLQPFRGSLGSHIYSYGSLQEGLQQYVANESAIGAVGGGTYAVNNYTFLPPSRPHQSAAVAHSAAMLNQATEPRDPSSYANREFGTGLDQQSTAINTQNLPGDELKQEPRSDEAGSGSANPAYDWQLISEGLFGGAPGDYFYLPGGSWPDMSQFTADPAGPAG